VEGVLNAFAHDANALGFHFGRKVAAQSVGTQRQGQVVLAAPPLSKVEHVGEAERAIGELSFVDHQAEIHRLGGNRIQDLIEGENYFLEIRFVKLECQVRGGQLAGDCNALPLDLRGRNGAGGRENRTVSV